MNKERIEAVVRALRLAICDCTIRPGELAVRSHEITCTYRVTIIRTVTRLEHGGEFELEAIMRDIIKYPPPPPIG